MQNDQRTGRSRGIQLYYITHIKNISSILKHGILSHQDVERKGIQFEPIYDASIVKDRRARLTPDGKSLWSYANLYFQARNPMLYRVICERPPDDVAVLAVDYNSVIGLPGVFISTGNAASSNSEIFPATPLTNRGRAFAQFRDVLSMKYWKEEDGSKRKIMAESLVPGGVDPNSINSIYVSSYESAERIRNELGISRFTRPNVIPDPDMFFQPSRTIPLTRNLTIVEGDMFFSRMQTLTVSVNCVGVMGKGLASRAKYQFPDVYVKYQDLCRNHSIRLGKPSLYKRERSFDYELADEPQTLVEANSETWFLLFPTKNHWREHASIDGIEKGLRWIQEKYVDEGIKSLAVPALGAGLGRLDWKEVGPLLCKYLVSMNIPVQIYLPAEKRIADDELSRTFLLPKNIQATITS